MFATRTSPLVKANPTQATDHAHRRDTPTFSWPVAHMTERTREQLIVLARSVFLYFSARPNRVVLFTGCSSQVGCTWVTVQTAGILAGHRVGSVCVVDACLRSPSVHKEFALERPPVLGDSTVTPAGLEGVVKSLDGVDDAIVTVETGSSDPVGVLASEEMKARLLELRAAYDYVLIDCAPAAKYPDASILAPLCDGVVLVMAAGHTRKDVAQFAKDRVARAGGKLLGAVLNRCESRRI